MLCNVIVVRVPLLLMVWGVGKLIQLVWAFAGFHCGLAVG